MRRRASDLLLLLGAAACLGLGGGVGCDPVLEGVTFRSTSVLSDPNDRFSPRDWYMVFAGKKAPGNGRAQLPYPLSAPFGIDARMGVFTESALAASVGAEGCIGLRDTGSSDEFRLCTRYETDPVARLVIFSNLDANTGECLPPATRAELRLQDDGMTVTARYRCGPPAAFAVLASTPSLSSDTEKWNAFVSATSLGKGGEVAFDDFEVESTGPFSETDDEAEIARAAFDALRLGWEAFYAVEDGNPTLAGALAGEAHGNVLFAQQSIDPGFAASSGAGKLLGKAESAHFKLQAGAEKFQKGFPKAAAIDADALDAIGTGF
jgi:hypothetical protein